MENVFATKTFWRQVRFAGPVEVFRKEQRATTGRDNEAIHVYGYAKEGIGCNV